MEHDQNPERQGPPDDTRPEAEGRDDDPGVPEDDPAPQPPEASPGETGVPSPKR